MADQADVNTPSLAYDDMMKHWELPIALRGGTLAMQEAKTKYLPQFDAESDAGYKARRLASVLYNAYGKTIAVLSGEPLKKPIVLVNASPQDDEIAEDVDLTGRDINAFAGERLDDILNFGKCHFFVAFPNTDALTVELGRPLTLQDERTRKVRPYFVRASPVDVIGWQGSRVNGIEKLSRVRVRESNVEQSGEWGEKVVNYVRVYTPGQIVRYREPRGEGMAWTLVESVSTGLDYIPLVTVYAKRAGLLKAYPPLEDLAWLNLQHWQASSDQFSILHFARTYLLLLRGWHEDDVKTVEIGVSKALANKDTTSGIDVVEHSGQAITAGREQLKDMEGQMRALGVDMVVPNQRVQVTATEAEIDKAEMVSELQLIARNLERGLRTGFEFAAAWQERTLPEDYQVNINQEYSPGSLSSTPLKDIRELWGGGLLTGRTVLEEHKRYGVLSSDLDVDAELAEAAEESSLNGAPVGMDMLPDEETPGEEAGEEGMGQGVTPDAAA